MIRLLITALIISHITSLSIIHMPESAVDKPFLLAVEDVSSKSGRGTIVTGHIEQGIVKVGDEVEIVGLGDSRKCVCTAVEMYGKFLDQGKAGDNVGLLLRNVEKNDIHRGQVVAKPGSITSHTKFRAEIYMLTKEEGGKNNAFSANYRPQFHFRTTDVTGIVHIAEEGREKVMPGDKAEIVVDLINPIAMDKGLKFSIREAGRTVGSGVVTEVYNE